MDLAFASRGICKAAVEGLASWQDCTASCALPSWFYFGVFLLLALSHPRVTLQGSRGFVFRVVLLLAFA